MNKQLTKISSIINEISMGPFGSDIKVENFVKDGVPVLNGSNLTGFKLVEEGFKYVTPEKAKTFKKAIARRGDIVITHRGTLGQISFIPDTSKFEEYVISQSQFRVALNRKIVDPAFFVYFFHTSEGQKRLLANKCHVGVPALAQATTNFKLIEIPLPNIDTQQTIASVLSTLDSKIELNNRINFELETMAKTLYDYWFVQFDFPYSPPTEGCPQDGVGIGKPYKSSGGLMVWNEQLKREIPEGWEVGELKDIANITMGQSPPGESYNEEGEGMIFFQGCTDFGIRFPSVRKFTTQPSRFAKEGDILLSVRAPVGAINIAKENCCIGRGLAALNSKDNCIAYLLGVMINLKQVFDRRNVDGTTFGSITKYDLYSLKVVRPDFEVLKKFNKIISPAFEKQNKIAKENQHLSSLRDWLLPMLMNGQVTVCEARKEIENTEKPIINLPEQHKQRFKLWLNNQGIAARGDIDTKTLRDIFDAMDDEDK
jgi:type I restriction enzyme S subunit